MQIPFLSFEETNRRIKTEMLSEFERLFDKAWYVLGDEVKSFEQAYASFNCSKHCIGVSNGLDALFLALKTINVGPGDEVIVPANTFIATLLAVTHTGATPVLVEPNFKTYNIDPVKLESAITAKTRAVIPVHLYGQACEMDKIMFIAKKHKLFIVEDNAQAQGASFAGQLTGTWGQINATSFYPGKNLGALGDAGALTTDDDTLAAQASLLRNYGSEIKYYHKQTGYNMRLDEFQAAFLSVKLKHLKEWTAQRQQIASMYNEALREVDEIILPFIHPEATHVYHQYVICTKQRNLLQKWLAENGVHTLIHYPIPPHLQPAYKNLGYQKGDFPITEQIADSCLSLPIYPGIKSEQVNYIGNLIKEFFSRQTLFSPSASGKTADM